ncbi:MAG TPA: helix-turn-helix transcriptional regulator [Solirubrobacteraceae bacterium]|nr:helix-turn-helix transcriptional regulator [Solirubrobacteraceae bacterium]
MSRTPRPDPALASAVRSLRERRGLSLEKLAFRSGVTPGALTQIELAQVVPRWDIVRRLAKGLGTSLVDLAATVETTEALLRAGVEDGPVA